MIGNDIVDLAQAGQDSNWRRKGFLEKIFTRHEQVFLQQSGNPELFVWLLWSMKESAYKAAVREGQQVIFAPAKISCRLLTHTANTASGEVTYAGKNYTTHSCITRQYVATYVQPPEGSFLHHILPLGSSDYAFQHQAIRAHISRQLSAYLSVAETAIAFEKDATGIPHVTVNHQTIPLSISHHGLFGAYYISY